MCRLAEHCPGYGFEVHKGYAVPQHLAALSELGPSVHHRSLYAPVVAARMKRDGIVIEADLFAEPLVALA